MIWLYFVLTSVWFALGFRGWWIEVRLKGDIVWMDIFVLPFVVLGGAISFIIIADKHYNFMSKVIWRFE